MPGRFSKAELKCCMEFHAPLIFPIERIAFHKCLALEVDGSTEQCVCLCDCSVVMTVALAHDIE